VKAVINVLLQSFEAYTLYSLVYLDWMTRSPLVHELYGTETKDISKFQVNAVLKDSHNFLNFTKSKC
jgi:hypothetical protein